RPRAPDRPLARPGAGELDRGGVAALEPSRGGRRAAARQSAVPGFPAAGLAGPPLPHRVGLRRDRRPAGVAGPRLHLAAAPSPGNLGIAGARREPRLRPRGVPPALARLAALRLGRVPPRAPLWDHPGGPARRAPGLPAARP